MVWDEGLHRVVLFGGSGSNGSVLNDTWTWDGSSWTKLNLANPPTTTNLPFHMVYDPVDGEIIVLLPGSYAGSHFTPPQSCGLYDNDTGWGCTLTDAADPTVNPTANVSGGGMAYDPLRQQVIFDSSDQAGAAAALASVTYSFSPDPGTWVPFAPAHLPPPTSGAAYAWDDGSAQILRFGGSTGAAVDTNVLWAWNGADWQSFAFANGPAGRTDAAMAYDEARRQVLMFGGRAGNASFSDTWTIQSPVYTQWTQIDTATNPGVESSYRVAFAYDESTQRTVLFGGVNPC